MKGRALYAATLGIKWSEQEVPLREILELSGEIGRILDGKGRTHAALSVLALFYFIARPDIDVTTMEKDERTKVYHDLAWFLEEGSFQLAAVLAAKRQEEQGPVNGLKAVAN